MIYFTLPNFHEFANVNNFLINLSKTKTYMFKAPVAFTQVSGGIPYEYWTGSFSTMHGQGLTHIELNRMYQEVKTPIRFVFDNIALEEFDYDNVFANIILDTFHNGSNIIELSNLQLLDHLSQQYPNYKYVFSKNANLINEYTPELLNQIISFNKFDLISLPDKYNKDFTALRNISDHKKIELTVNPSCALACKNYQNCRILQHLSQLEFSNKEIIPTCHKSYNATNLISMEDILHSYLPIGINHFTFENFSTKIYTENSLVAFYIDYFIQPEYQYLVLKTWLGREVLFTHAQY